LAGRSSEAAASTYLLQRCDNAGKIEGVRYEELAPMRLNEMQKQQRKFAAQAGDIREWKAQQQLLIIA
jgi:hypothetical protein